MEDAVEAIEGIFSVEEVDVVNGIVFIDMGVVVNGSIFEDKARVINVDDGTVVDEASTMFSVHDIGVWLVFEKVEIIINVEME
ncbi:hypothetical protein NDU88_003190 [Pleurodeles waltl]|uniref:Uncharacterized protein n=1 Tax=Pleurodeles waltl TaxID=8319 RepID=A0AAV7MPU7_PLEWA|nr:hypothetical protein NDU88_003190 [Pleurodeles waltl]